VARVLAGSGSTAMSFTKGPAAALKNSGTKGLADNTWTPAAEAEFEEVDPLPPPPLTGMAMAWEATKEVKRLGLASPNTRCPPALAPLTLKARCTAFEDSLKRDTT